MRAIFRDAIRLCAPFRHLTVARPRLHNARVLSDAFASLQKLTLPALPARTADQRRIVDHSVLRPARPPAPGRTQPVAR